MTTEPKAITQADLDKVLADLEAVKTNNEKLIAENRKAKADLRAAKEIDPAEVEKLESENEKLRTDLAKAQKDSKDATTRAEKAEKAHADESGYTAKLLKENALNEALAGAGVTDPDFLAAAKAMMGGSAQVVTDGENRVVKIGDKALADHIKEWSGTDAAKKFITPPQNNGGGAPGGKGGASGKTMDRDAFKVLPAGDQTKFLGEGGKVVDMAA